MPNDLQIEIDAERLKQILARQTQKLQHAPQLMQSIAQTLQAHTELAFKNEGLTPAQKWPALATATQKARQRQGHGGAHPILRGRQPNLLRNFYTQATSQSATLANDTIYAAIHQFGGKAGRNRATTLPARPFLPLATENGKHQLTPAVQQAISKLVNHWLAA